jgi:hypothetical protein
MQLRTFSHFCQTFDLPRLRFVTMAVLFQVDALGHNGRGDGV